jgi:hypothetical protein
MEPKGEILKYMVFLTAMQKLTLSKGAVILDVQEQDGALALWAAHATRIISAENSEEVTLYMIGTGDQIPSDYVRYICTIQHGKLVVHIFEGPRE